MAKRIFTDESLDALVSNIKNCADSALDSANAYTDSVASGKSNSDHTHDGRYYTETEINNKLASKSDSNHTHDYVPTSRTINNKTLNANITLSADDVGADKTGSANTALSSAKTYTDNAIKSLGNTYYTETEIDSKVSTINSAIAGKAPSAHTHGISEVTNLKSSLDLKANSDHSHNNVSLIEAGFMSPTDKAKLNGIATGAEVNQNAFSNVVVGSTTIEADSTNDTLTIAAGTGISVSGDAANDKVTITNSGVHSISTGGTNGSISVNTNGTSADVPVKGLGSAAYTASTAYDAAGTAKTKADAALASAKSYADGIKNDLLNGAGEAYDTLKELGALIDVNTDAIDALETVAASKASKTDLTSHTGNKSNPHEVTLAQLGVTATAAELNIMDGVTATAAEINKLDGVTATTAELNYVDGVTSSIQAQLDTKQATITGAATTIAGSNLTESRALISNSSGKVAVSAVTSTELGYLDGVTSAIQTQLDGKAASKHGHNYAGSSSDGGAATSANKVNSSMTIKLNSGDTEGTNMFTFNGSAAKAINITSSAIGAAASSHTHDDKYYTETEIDSKISTINTAINGKAASSHTHDDRYYTETEINTKVDALNSAISGKAPSTHNHSASQITSGTIAAARLPAASGSDAGITVVYPADQCTTFTSDSGACTPAAVKKAVSSFAITKEGGGTITNNSTSQKDEPSIKWKKVGDNTPYIGFATDQSDGTFVFGSLTGTEYRTGLAIGGGSGNLLWKGVKVATADDIASHNHSASQITSGTLPIARGGTGATTADDALTNLGAVGRIDTANSSTNGGTGEIFNSYYDTSKNKASGKYSHAEGWITEASGDYSHAEGYDSCAHGDHSHAEGVYTNAYGESSHTEGRSTDAHGEYSHAEGFATHAVGESSHAEGGGTGAYGDRSHAEGDNTEAYGSSSHAEGSTTFAYGLHSHSEGYASFSMGRSSHSEGELSCAYGFCSHSEGGDRNGATVIILDSGTQGSLTYEYLADNESGNDVNIEVGDYCLFINDDVNIGVDNTVIKITSVTYDDDSGITGTITFNASPNTKSDIESAIGILIKHAAMGDFSHVEGYLSKAIGNYSHAEGYRTTASGSHSHAEGTGCVASGSASHAEGQDSKATNHAAHAEGGVCEASGSYSHAEGGSSKATHQYAHAEGHGTTASNFASHSEGYYTKASNYASHAQGKYNKSMTTGGAEENTTGDAMVIGNGTRYKDDSGWHRTDSNAFRVTYAGQTYGLSSFNSSGADYAEFFEWEDGNELDEDRVGYFVTMNDNHIIKANPNDYILGVVSGEPCIIGNSDEDWLGRWEHDEFGRFIKEDVDTHVTEMKEVEVEVLDEDGKPTGETKTEMQEVETGEIIHGWRYKANPEYDNTKEYIERKDRKEWDAVGMLGVLSVRDDGTCEVNGYAKVSQGGIATKAESYIHGMTYRVIKRMSDNVIQIVFR